MAECRICSSKTVVLTAQEQEEYNILKDLVTLNDVSGHLQAKYSFKKDPGVPIDNGKDAKVCQINHKRWQIRSYQIALVFDISMAYIQSRLALWRSISEDFGSISILSKTGRSTDLTAPSFETDQLLLL